MHSGYHLFPIVTPVLAVPQGKRPAAFPFFYIEPSKKEHLPITQKFTGPISLEQAERIAPIGVCAGAHRGRQGADGGWCVVLALPPLTCTALQDCRFSADIEKKIVEYIF